MVNLSEWGYLLEPKSKVSVLLRSLFGLIDYHRSLTAKQRNRILTAPAVAAETHGTDATGIACNSGGKLRIYKRPWPARRIHFRVPVDAEVIMGHTRMATQRNAAKSRNNHPCSTRA